MRPPRSPAAYAAVITAACFSLQAVGVGIYISYGVFFTPLIETFGWSRAAVSGASSLAFFVMGAVGILLGRLNDRFGPRRLMAVAAVFYGLGFSLMATVSNLFQLYLVIGLIFGIGLSSVDVIALTTVTRWFSGNRGKMTGLVKVGTGAGQMLFPVLAGFLIARFGFQLASVFIGVGAFLLLAVISRLLYRDPDTYGRHRGTGETACTEDAPCGTPAQTRGMTFSQALKTREFWLLCTSSLLMLACLLSVMIHIVPHGRDIGVPALRAAGVLSAIGAVSMLGRFGSGIIIDRTGSKPIMIASFILALAGLFWLTSAATLWALYLFAAVYGIAHGSFFTGISPMVAELFGIRSHGSLVGVILFFGTAGGALGPFITGLMFDRFQGYGQAFWVLIGFASAAFVLMLMIRVPSKVTEAKGQTARLEKQNS